MFKFLRLIFASVLLFPHPGAAATYLWEFDIELTSLYIVNLDVWIEPSSPNPYDPANIGEHDYSGIMVTPDTTDNPIVQKIFEDYHPFSGLSSTVGRAGIRFDGVGTGCLYGAFCQAYNNRLDAMKRSIHVTLTADGELDVRDWYTGIPIYWYWGGSLSGGRTVFFDGDDIGLEATIDGYNATWGLERASFRVTNESLWRLEPVPVPIPAGLPLLASALAVLAYRYRRGRVTSSRPAFHPMFREQRSTIERQMA